MIGKKVSKLVKKWVTLVYFNILVQQHVYDQMAMRDIKSQPSYQNLECIHGEENPTNKIEENAGNYISQIVTEYKCLRI